MHEEDYSSIGKEWNVVFSPEYSLQVKRYMFKEVERLKDCRIPPIDITSIGLKIVSVLRKSIMWRDEFDKIMITIDKF